MEVEGEARRGRGEGCRSSALRNAAPAVPGSKVVAITVKGASRGSRKTLHDAVVEFRYGSEDPTWVGGRGNFEVD